MPEQKSTFFKYDLKEKEGSEKAQGLCILEHVDKLWTRSAYK